jgi:hypothetical protein
MRRQRACEGLGGERYAERRRDPLGRDAYPLFEREPSATLCAMARPNSPRPASASVSAATEFAPADWPTIVTLPGSLPKIGQ